MIMLSPIAPPLSDRDLIDAAIADGKVTVCPIGANSQPKYVWDADQGKLVQSDGMVTSWQKLKFHNAKDAMSRRPDVIAARERRSQLPAMIAQGMTGPQIAARLGVTVDAVRSDAKKLKISLAPSWTSAKRETRGRVKLYMLANPQSTHLAAAEALSISLACACNHITRLRRIGELPRKERLAAPVTTGRPPARGNRPEWMEAGE